MCKIIWTCKCGLLADQSDRKRLDHERVAVISSFTSERIGPAPCDCLAFKRDFYVCEYCTDIDTANDEFREKTARMAKEHRHRLVLLKDRRQTVVAYQAADRERDR